MIAVLLAALQCEWPIGELECRVDGDGAILVYGEADIEIYCARQTAFDVDVHGRLRLRGSDPSCLVWVTMGEKRIVVADARGWLVDLSSGGMRKIGTLSLVREAPSAPLECVRPGLFGVSDDAEWGSAGDEEQGFGTIQMRIPRCRCVTTPPDVSALGPILRDLTHEDYDVRERAFALLAEFDASTIHAAYRSARDPELVARLREALKRMLPDRVTIDINEPDRPVLEQLHELRRTRLLSEWVELTFRRLPRQPVEPVDERAVTGTGVVIGLARTGDSDPPVIDWMVRRVGDELPGHAAAVFVSATIQKGAKPGQAVDVVVQATGDAFSLEGGTLYLTALRRDGRVLAVAQGPVVVDGDPGVGRVRAGAIIEK